MSPAKLFWRDHRLAACSMTLAWLVVLLIYWLDGYRNLTTGLYAVFLGILVISGYLAYRYFTHNAYYQMLAQPPAELSAMTRPLDQASVSEALHQLLLNQFQIMQSELERVKIGKQTHVTFINQWVHQMKTPLSIMELALQDPSGSLDNAKIDSMREELERLRRGLETVLHAARLQSFERDFLVKTVNLSAVAESAVHHHKRLFIHRHIYPETAFDHIIQVRTDEKWLEFMLGQLMTNAIKYTIDPANKVTIRTYVRNHEAVVEIEDRGIGIPLSDRKRVFSPFYTGDNGRRFHESTGMGLYLVDQACKQLEHRIELDSAVGRGTTVRILFSAWQSVQPGASESSVNEPLQE